MNVWMNAKTVSGQNYNGNSGRKSTWDINMKNQTQYIENRLNNKLEMGMILEYVSLSLEIFPHPLKESRKYLL